MKPSGFRENREAGENPARSRHCEVLEAADTSATDLIFGKAVGGKGALVKRTRETESGDLPASFTTSR